MFSERKQPSGWMTVTQPDGNLSHQCFARDGFNEAPSRYALASLQPGGSSEVMCTDRSQLGVFFLSFWKLITVPPRMPRETIPLSSTRLGD